MSEWSPDHWLLMVGFFGMLAVCVVLLVRAPALRFPGVPSHDLATRMQSYISEIDQRIRDMPKPREVRELGERIRALETVTTAVQSDVRAQRDSSVRIEHQLNLLLATGLERERERRDELDGAADRGPARDCAEGAGGG